MNTKVFCNELNRLVSGEEVWEFKYGNQRINQELTFKCPDISCTARFIVRNCLAHFNACETEFRLYPRSYHRTGCSYQEFLRNKRNFLLRKACRVGARPNVF